MSAVAAAFHAMLQAIADVLAGPMAWARSLSVDVWIMATVSLLLVIVVWALIGLKKKIKPASSPKSASPESHQTTVAEAQAALLQALDANEYQQEQLNALKSDLAQWSEALRTQPPDASIEALLSAIKQTAAQANARVATLHQQAKSQQIKTLNQAAEEADAVLSTASKALMETMTDWLTHHQDLYDQLDGLSTSLKTLAAHHESPGSVRHEFNLQRIEALSRTLDGLARSLETLGQDLHRVEQLMLGPR